MKKILSLLLLCCFIFAAVSCGNTPVSTESPTDTTAATTASETSASEATTSAEATTETTVVVNPVEFDEDNIVFSFGAISDIHIDVNTDTSDASVKFLSALNQLKAKAAESDADGIDAIFTAGDLIDSRQTYQIQQYKKIYTSVFDVTEVPNIYCLGHYHDDNWTSATVNADRNNFTTIFGEDFFIYDVEPERIPTGCRHCEITADDGTVYHVLTLEPISIDPTYYSTESKEWLEKTLTEITTEHPDQYVFILNHCMIYDTVYGSDLGTYWYTQDLTDILSKFPQVVTFSGHLHFPLNDERSIMQTSFTSLGTGAVRYMAIESGGYENMASSTTMNDRYEFSEGLLCQMDKNGNMRIIRMDFYDSTTIGEDWVISHPTADNSHLQTYQRASRTEANTAPEITTFKLQQAEVKNGLQTTLIYGGTDDQFVHHYVISYYKEGVLRKQYKVLSDFYKHGQWSDMKKELAQLIGTLSYGKSYKITIQAIDSWGATSELKEMEFTPEKADDPGTDDPGTGGTPADVPEPYVDFDIDADGIYDTKNHVVVLSSTGSASSKSVTFGDITTTKYIYMTKNAAATCQFTDITNTAEMKAWAENGFTVEAFFSVRSLGTTQGIICGTEAGGWGLAVNGSGNPYFITGSGATANVYNPSATASTVVDGTTLVHVVAVYDYATRTQSLYVNGELEAQTMLYDDFFPGAGSAVNEFCIGADVTSTGEATQFIANNLKLVDAKIYNCALTSSQVASEFKAETEWLSK